MKVSVTKIVVKTKVGENYKEPPVGDVEVEALLKSSRYNSLMAAIAIAVNNFNRACDEFIAEVSE